MKESNLFKPVTWDWTGQDNSVEVCQTCQRGEQSGRTRQQQIGLVASNLGITATQDS